MEPIGAKFNEEWESSLGEIFSYVEDDHLMANLYCANNEYASTFNKNGITSSNFLSIDEANMNINEVESANLFNFTNSFNPNFYQFSEENSNSSGSNGPFFPTLSYENNFFSYEPTQTQKSNNNIHESTNISSDVFSVQNCSHRVMEELLFMKTEMVNEKSEDGFNRANSVADLSDELKLKRKINLQEDAKNNDFTESPKNKKPRLPGDAQKGKRNALTKKNKKVSISSCSSEDDNTNITSQDSQTEVTASVNSSGKIRASRGAATDPQSLYARRRRERINERLRILQNLVPNGTKVDISTMLEEAVQYVKFLKLQIKLLSSDKMWMFAPIAYNGMDMGLYDRVSR